MASYVNEVLADSPSVFWRLQETSGSAAADASGNSRPGTYVGSPTLANFVGPTKPEQFSVLLFGLSQAVQADSNTWCDFGPTSTFTVEIWADLVGVLHNLVQKINGTTGWRIATTGSNTTLQWSMVGNGHTLSRNFTWGGQVQYTKHHLVFTYDGSLTQAGIKAFLDGVELTGTAQLTTLLSSDTVSNTGSLLSNGGTSNGTIPITTAIAGLAVYPTVLSQARILAHYNAIPTYGSRSQSNTSHVLRSVSRPARNIIPPTYSSTGSSRRRRSKTNLGIN